MELVPADLDGDGQVGGIEKINQSFPNEIMQAKETTELGDVMNKAFEDKLDPETRTSTMDMLANVKTEEEVYLFVINSIVSLDFLPQDVLGVTRQKLRLSVSRDARGRNDIRDISIGKRDQDLKASQKLGNFMGGQG